MTAARVLEVVLPTPSGRVADRVAAALSIETLDAPAGATVQVSAEGTDLVVRIEAEELRALRAAAHGFLRWADAAIAVARQAVT